MLASVRVAVALLLLAALPAIAQGAGSATALQRTAADSVAIGRIREVFQAVERHASEYVKIEREVEGFSVDGAKLIAYFEGDTLRKIHVDHGGESGRAFEDDYFSQGKLVFVFLVIEQYAMSMSGKVQSRTEHRYYFENSRLFRHVRTPARHSAVDGPDPTAKGLLRAARTYVACANATAETFDAACAESPGK